MTVLIVPLRSVPSQTLSVQLEGQSCQINVYQRFFGVFLDLYSDNVLIVGGAKCENLNRLVRSKYLGFDGDLVFFDQQTDDKGEGLNPTYDGLGDRYVLLYLSEDEIAARVAAS